MSEQHPGHVGPDAAIPKRSRRPGRVKRRRPRRETFVPGLAEWTRREARQMKWVFRQARQQDPHGFRLAAVRELYRALAPKGKRGARRDLRIDQALWMWRQQQRRKARGEIRSVNWQRIALACIPDWARMPPEGRKRSLRRLRNAVHNRAHRAAGKAGRRGEHSRKDWKKREPDVAAKS